MSDWTDLSDDELRSRLLASGFGPSTIGFLVRERDNEYIAARISRYLGGDTTNETGDVDAER